MDDRIYIVDRSHKTLTHVEPISLSDIGISETRDLEQWIVNHPEVLGEPLLVISSEFDRFDKSRKRLDVLALDKTGCLVIVELKLDAERSLADLQAIRYAAFCSTMTMDQIVETFRQAMGLTHDEAITRIQQFLETEELPSTERQPRIILAAGSVDDQELTSTVLWLRGFGIDVSCIELTPYQLANDSHIVLVPKRIIPLAEAEDYIVRVERKETMRRKEVSERSEDRAFWDALLSHYAALTPRFAASKWYPPSPYVQIHIGNSSIHYEWFLRKRPPFIGISLHFEGSNRDWNMELVNRLAPHEGAIREGVDAEYIAGEWGKKWAQVTLRMAHDAGGDTSADATCAAELMQLLIERTYPVLEPILSRTRRH